MTTPASSISIHRFAVSDSPFAPARHERCGIVTTSANPCSVVFLMNSRRLVAMNRFTRPGHLTARKRHTPD